MNDRDALRILNALPGIGPVTLNRLLEAFGEDPQAILGASEAQLMGVKGAGQALCQTIQHWKSFVNLEKEDAALNALGARWIAQDDPDFPALLHELPDCPIGLYARGKAAVSDKAVAIVGTRRPTLYGREVARQLAADLARLGFWVVSGGARGIDTAAHKGALQAGGKTAVLLGCGLDITYPPENLDLFREIAQTGVVFSEFPIGRKADKQTFPQRNRLISGMTLATVVVESGARGGSMLTANFAADQGRQVLAVPGRIDQESSRGCHALIREGATLLSGIDDLLEALQYTGAPRKDLSPETRMDGSGNENLTAAEKQVLAQLEAGALRTAEEIAEGSHLPLSACNSALTMLEIKRRIVRHLDGRFEAR